MKTNHMKFGQDPNTAKIRAWLMGGKPGARRSKLVHFLDARTEFSITEILDSEECADARKDIVTTFKL
jgi:hypothetical protein